MKMNVLSSIIFWKIYFPPDFPERSKYVYEIVQVALLKSLIRISLIDDPLDEEIVYHCMSLYIIVY